MQTTEQKLAFKADPAFRQADRASKVLTGTGGSGGNPNAARTIDIGYRPRPFMIPFHQRSQRFSCIVAHRRAGKTVGSLADMIHEALKHKGGDGRFAFCGPTYAQIKDVVWQYLKQYTYPLPNTKINEADLQATLFNGSRIKLYSLDSTAYDRMRGVYLDGCTIDEYADCDPRALPEVIRPALADRQGWLSIIGTSKGRDAFFRVYREACKSTLWYTAKLKVSETGILPPEEVEALKEMMGPNEYAREMECSFDVEGYDQLIPGYLVEDARQRQIKGHDPMTPLVFGLDVARFGDDRTVLVMRKGKKLLKGWVWREADLMQTADAVAKLANQHQPRAVFCDEVGVGAGVVDRLKHLGYQKVTGVNMGRKARNQNNYINHRAECYGRLKDWLETAEIPESFELVEEFEEDVTSLTYKYDNNGRLDVEGKDDLKAKGLPSPDIGDAVALTFSEILPASDMLAAQTRALPNGNSVVPFDDNYIDNW